MIQLGTISFLLILRLLTATHRTQLPDLAEAYDSEEEWTGESISADDGNGEGDEAPRMSGSELNNLATMVLPDPRDAVNRCVFRLPETKHNRPPKNLPNRNYHFFFDLEDTIYTRRNVQVRKYEFLTNFLKKQMLITDESEIKELILKRKEKLEQMLEFKRVKYEDPYDFIIPEKAVTQLVQDMQARLWIFTKSDLDHARKVLKLMELEQYFSGIIYSPRDLDYGKSQKVFFDVAALATGLDKPSHAFFIDDSALNVFMAKNCKWHGVLYYNPKYHKRLPKFYEPFSGQVHRVAELRQVRQVFPQLFAAKK